MNYTIKSKKFNADFEFSKYDGNNMYVRVYSKAIEWCVKTNDAKQICHGGGLMGDTISANDEDFIKICRNWYKQYIKNESDSE